MTAAMDVEASVTINSSMTSPQLELDRDFDDDVDRRAAEGCRRETPLTHGLRRAIVQAAAETLEDLHVADAAVGAHDDLHHDVAGQILPAGVFGVVRFHLTQQARRL